MALDRVLLSIDLGAAWMGALVSALNLDGDFIVSFADDSSCQIRKSWLCLSKGVVCIFRKVRIVVVVYKIGSCSVDGCRS